jgi:anti-sigma regulatory factor (Ser/Thr protein kinase)
MVFPVLVEKQAASQERPEVRIEIRFEPGQTAVRTLRALVRTLLQDHRFPEDQIEPVVLGLDEALMNACEHGVAEEDPRLGLNVLLYADRLLLEVLDRGNAPIPDQAQEGCLPEDDSESGRGLFLIQHIMDEVAFLPREGGGTCVRLVKRR